MGLIRNIHQARSLMSSMISILLVFLMAACGPERTSSHEQMPEIDVELSAMNKVIRLHPYEGEKEYRIGSDIFLVLENASDHTIIFPRDYGIQVFMRDGDSWASLINSFGYPERTIELLPIEQQPFGGNVVILHPLLDQDGPVLIRVIVVGEHKTAASPESTKVGAYIDLTLLPK